MKTIKIAIIGAGSQSFGPTIIRDIYSSGHLTESDVELRLMDINSEHLKKTSDYAEFVSNKTKKKLNVSSTVELEEALADADFVITAIEKDRFLHWSEEFHVPRKYGFKQVFGENGGPGGIFHALRNMKPMLKIARTMEKICPDAWLVNFTNPESKICEMLTRLTSIKTIGLCHGIYDGMRQISDILEIPEDKIEFQACGMNHFTWFRKIREKSTGNDLYPQLIEAEKNLDWWWHFHELGISRILFRLVGLWPSPGPDHCGEYLSFAEEFVCTQMQFFYDPRDGSPRQTADIPEFLHLSQTGDPTFWPRDRKQRKDNSWFEEEMKRRNIGTLHNVPVYTKLEDIPIEWSREAAIPFIEGIALGLKHNLAAVNVQNNGAVPDIPNDMVVEIPLKIKDKQIVRPTLEPLPRFVTGIMHQQYNINRLLIDAFDKNSKDLLIQALLLDPTVNSYRNTVYMVDEMLRLNPSYLS